MKPSYILSAIFLSAALMVTHYAHADVWANGYWRADGTYVPPHDRSAPDSYRWNNYGSSDRGSFYSHGGRDSDGDGVWNQFDFDDDNNGIVDDFEW